MVTLKANVNDFKRQMGKATESLGDLEKRAGGAEKVAGTAMGKIAQSARLQADSWDAVGGSLTKAGVATMALSAVVLKTGISYNTLQQTSRAALTTLLGGAEQANAQMDKLDAFAKTSPFAKDVFIQAQQQMLGFGIEAKKVIPYLSAINEAVAATGGSNQDIAELTRIFSQVQAAAKITATDLMQFGQRGVDAATLIGSEMGKSGAQIRSEITAGTLDAGQALDALAAGMQDRFGGASAMVKDTMGGAIDRVKAAFRDLASTLATPLVDPNGGGFLVDMTNGLADFLRTIEAAPGPLKQIIFYGGALLGVVALLGGAMMKGGTAVINYRAHLATLAETFPKLATAVKVANVALGAIGAALAIATVAWGLYAKVQAEDAAAVEGHRSAAEELRGTLEATTGAITAQTRELIINRLEASGALAAYTNLGGAAGDLADVVLGNAEATARYSELMREHGKAVDLGVDSYIAYSGEAKTVDDAVGSMATQLGMAKDATERITEETEGATEGLHDFAAAQEAATAVIQAARDAINAQADALETLRNQTMGAERSAIALEESMVKLSDAVSTNGATIDINTEAGRNNRSAILDAIDATNKHAQSMLDSGSSYGEVKKHLETSRQRMIEMGVGAGIAEGDMIALVDSMLMIPKEVSSKVTVSVGAALSAIAAVNSKLNAIDGKTAYAQIKVYGQGAVATGGPVGPLADVVRRVQYRASGGPVTGPGGPTDDLIPASGPFGTRFQLSNKEWIIRAASAEKYGGAAMAAVNAGTATIQYRAAGGPAEPNRFYVPAVGAGGRGGSQGGSFSVEGARITGKLDVGGVLVDLVDGRLSMVADSVAAEGRAV